MTGRHIRKPGKLWSPIVILQVTETEGAWREKLRHRLRETDFEWETDERRGAPTASHEQGVAG
jgi:hypothetical protein